MLREKFENDWTTEKNIMDEREFPRFEFKMGFGRIHNNDVIMSAMASKITSLRTFTQPFIQAQNKKKYQSSASLAFVRGIHRSPVNSPHKRPVTGELILYCTDLLLHRAPASRGRSTAMARSGYNNGILCAIATLG